jgi:magnesium chelatase family protein
MVNCWVKSVSEVACIGGPLLDRIDIHIEVPAVPFEELSNGPPGTSSAQMREQVTSARQIQRERFANSKTRTNAQMSSRELRQWCPLGPIQTQRMRAAVSEMGLSARAHDKIIRVARTIADLEQSPHIEPNHIEEAINFRMLDRDIWR